MDKLEKSLVESVLAKHGSHVSRINLSNNGESNKWCFNMAYVHNLGLRDVDNIVLLKDLIKLNLSKNSLSIVKVLGSLTSLMELDLSENEMYV